MSCFFFLRQSFSNQWVVNGVLNRAWVRGYLEEQGWLRSSCIPEEPIPAWVMTCENHSSWALFRGQFPSLSIHLGRGLWDSSKSPLSQACDSLFASRVTWPLFLSWSECFNLENIAIWGCLLHLTCCVRVSISVCKTIHLMDRMYRRKRPAPYIHPSGQPLVT